MKQIQMLALLLLSQTNYALQIHQVCISQMSPAVINVSLNTEAEELYYFHSWRSNISGRNITIEAFYIEGFGSTIAYLNNNFEIPLTAVKKAFYQLDIKIYYTDLCLLQNSKNVQDQWSGSFSTPIAQPVFLNSPTENNLLNLKYQNPNPGFITTGSQKVDVIIFDEYGNAVENKKVKEYIDFSYLPDGKYFLRLECQNTTKTIPIILKK